MTTVPRSLQEPWPAAISDIIGGDLVAAFATPTPQGGGMPG